MKYKRLKVDIINKIILIGNVGSTPELKTTGSGIAVANFSLAVNDRKKADGTQDTSWFKVVVWRQLAELCEKFVEKGRKVAIVGSVRLSLYTKSDGTQGASMEVTADEVEFLSPKGERSEVNDNPAPAQSKNEFIRVDDEELPF